jgi:hypothetical protein
MNEKMLTGLLGRFMTEEVSARGGMPEDVDTLSETAGMLAGA